MTLLSILIGLAHAKDSAIGGLDSPGGSIVWHVIGLRCHSAAGRRVRAGQDGACWLRISGLCRASALRGLQQHDARSPSQINLQHAGRMHCVVKSQRARTSSVAKGVLHRNGFQAMFCSIETVVVEPQDPSWLRYMQGAEARNLASAMHGYGCRFHRSLLNSAPKYKS
jgi:hypothetical protein